MEIWSAVIGAAVGALLGIAGSFVVTRRHATRAIQADESHSVAATAQQTHPTHWYTGVATAQQMLIDLDDMRGRLDHLDPLVNPAAPSRLAATTTEQERADAHAAHDRLREMTKSHAVQLPDSLGTRWYSLTQLIDEYVEIQRQRGDWWDGPRFERVKDDVQNYLAFVRQSLAEYVKTGKETEIREPPVLSREDQRPWTST